MATANGYTDDDRKRIVSAMQSMRDRLGGFLAKTYGDNFDGDIDTMLEAVNFMKAVRIEKPAAVPEGYAPVPVEPTTHMLRAAQAAWTPGVSDLEAHAIRYRAMLAAARAAAVATEIRTSPAVILVAVNTEESP